MRNEIKSKTSRDRDYFRRILKLCPLRLELGRIFVDRLTPPVKQEFFGSQTVSLLLLDKIKNNIKTLVSFFIIESIGPI